MLCAFIGFLVYTTTRDKNRILELENKEKSAKKLAKKIN
jgi:hypothetical protein